MVQKVNNTDKRCKRCKRIFISDYHLMNHELENCNFGNAIPFLSLQHMNEEDLVKIASYLDLQTLVNMVVALPRLLIFHGMHASPVDTYV